MNEIILEYDIVVIGGGPAGLASAIEAKKNNIDSILIIERDKELGGILNQCIHNGFGIHIFKEELTGPEYAEKFIKELKEYNIEYKLDTMVTEITEEKMITAINSKDGIVNIKAKAIILAMGCRERTRGSINIPGSRPAGVYTAGMAQRLINIDGYNIGKDIIILGSGDIGMIMARRLVLEGSNVIAVLSRGEYAAGLTRNIVQCLEDFNIPLLLNHTITKINGKDRVESVNIAKTYLNKNIIEGTEKEYKCDTVLLSVGLIPENELSLQAGVIIDENTKGPVVNNNMETNIDGIFACGNVLHVHDIVDFVTAESRKAGENAAKYIKNILNKDNNYIEIAAGNGINYIIPQKIQKNNEQKTVELFFRVKDKYENINIIVKNNNKIIRNIKKDYILPIDMQKIVLKSNLLENINGNLIIEILKDGE